MYNVKCYTETDSIPLLFLLLLFSIIIVVVVFGICFFFLELTIFFMIFFLNGNLHFVLHQWLWLIVSFVLSEFSVLM